MTQEQLWIYVVMTQMKPGLLLTVFWAVFFTPKYMLDVCLNFSGSVVEIICFS
jgi:hypothetical protein